MALAGVALLAPACGSSPFEDYSIRAVKLRTAPRVDFLRAPRGMKFLQVQFEFENRSSQPMLLRATDFSLEDTAGKLHPFSAQLLDMGQPKGTAEAVLDAGGVASGSVIFQIPSSAQPGAMIYKQDVSGGLIIPLLSSD